MKAKTRLIPYPEERALEDAAYARSVAPTRIFAILLPVWRVEIKATITDGEPYELIDRFLERGITEANLGTVGELAEFFALDDVLVDRALRFLAAIGHLETSKGRLAMTELGLRSVRDKKRYVVTREDRRKLFFDEFGSRPLPRPYYDHPRVTFLSEAALEGAVAEREGPRFMALHSSYGFRREALAELAAHPERDRFNLPERIDHPQSLGEERVYLPIYVVRGIEVGHKVRYLAYSQMSDEADIDVSRICEQTAEIVNLLETEERMAHSHPDRIANRIANWLRNRGLDPHRPVQSKDGTWHITLPPSSFDTNGALSITKIGSFVVLGNDVLRVWCADESARRESLLERLDSYLSARVNNDQADIDKRIARIARQLELGALDSSGVRQMAVDASRRGLMKQLDQLR